MLKRFSPALKLALLFLLLTTSWVLFSDALASFIAGDDIKLLHQVQHVKGVVFAAICSTLVYFLSRYFYKKIENSLRTSEETLKQFQALEKATREAIIDYNLKKDSAIINEQMQNYMQANGAFIDNFLENFLHRIHIDDKQRIKANLINTLNTTSGFWQADFKFKLHNGKYHDVIIRGSIIRNEKGEAERFIAVLQDVSELRNIKTAYYEQQIKYRQMLGQSIIKAQERERNRWAEELHDNVGQLLTVVKLFLDQMAAEKEYSPQLIEKSQEITQKALDDIRQLSASIKPPEFSHNTLKQSIEALINNIMRVKAYEFVVDLEEMDEAMLSNEQKLMIYRVVQEQLNNIIKYADATIISVTAGVQDQTAFVEVSDNGKGFNTEKVESGIGLRNIRSRLQVYSGSLHIESGEGKGCLLKAEFSLS